MPLFRDVVSVTFGGWTGTNITAVGVNTGGQEIAFTGDDATEEQFVDVVSQTTTVTVYTADLNSINALSQTATPGTLIARIKSADGLGDKILTFSNAKFMGDDANPKHASVDSAGVLSFECASSDGATSPLAVTDPPA